jgi:hypothetical protein
MWFKWVLCLSSAKASLAPARAALHLTKAWPSPKGPTPAKHDIVEKGRSQKWRHRHKTRNTNRPNQLYQGKI